MWKRTLYSAEHLSFSFKRAIFPPCYNFRILEITARGIRDPWLWIPECKPDKAFENPVPGVGNPQREIHLAVQYLLRIICLYSVMRLVGVGLVRNSKKVKWERLMVQKQYPVDLVIKYII